MYICIVLIVIIVLLFFTLCLAVIADRKNAKLFTDGTWIDRDGNLLVMKLKDNKITLSFGVNTNGDEYELTEKKYSYSYIRLPFSSTYKIKVNNGVTVNIDINSGSATVYNKKKKVGRFAKNNLLLFD